MKVLNLYAGIGGNRKEWEGCEVTAVEYTQEIADVYSGFFPDDEVVVADAHQYLLDNYERFDFIWASPPCQSHSKMIRSGRNRKPRYPDFKLYEEIVFLKNNFKGLWVVENVVPYYKPLIEAKKMGRHLVWANFDFGEIDVPSFGNFINAQNLAAKERLMEWLGMHYEKNIYYEGNHCPTQILRNCVHPSVGGHIYEAAQLARMITLQGENMEAVYACQLTWEQFQVEVAKGTPINTFQGHLLSSRDRHLEPNQMWAAYREEFLAASVANIPISDEVIASNNAVVIPMVESKTPAPLAVLRPQVAAVCAEPRNAKGRSFSCSYSAANAFDGTFGCPLKYAHDKFYCTTPFQSSAAMDYGNNVHEAAEIFVRDGRITNQEHFAPVEKYARLFRSMKEKGIEAVPELTIVLDRDLKPLTGPKAYFSDDAWFRCKIDQPIIQEVKAAIYDYKTGKTMKEDHGQLHLCMAALSIIRPEIEDFTGKLIWTKFQDTTGCPPLKKPGAAQIWDQFMERTRKMEDAWATENFPAIQNGLCRQYCDVVSCQHNGKR